MHPRTKVSTIFPLLSWYLPTAAPQWEVPSENETLAQIWVRRLFEREQLVALVKFLDMKNTVSDQKLKEWKNKEKQNATVNY